jgi:dihydrodipicolinate synthase/N-acetylneuraminate lyase
LNEIPKSISGAAALHGVIPVSPTPYHDDGSVDYDSIRTFVDYIVAKGIHGLATTGGSGRFWQLTDAERGQIARVTVEQVRGRVPVICGVAGPSIENAVLYTQLAQDAGADAVFAMPVYVHGLAPDEMFEYYAAIARAARVPVVVQDVVLPGGSPIPTAILARLAQTFEIIRYVKEETPAGNRKASEIIATCGDRLPVLVGAGGFGFLDALQRGCAGCMPGPVNIGGLVRCYEAFRADDLSGARQWYEATLPLIALRMQVGGITKEILKRIGAIRGTYERPPREMALDEHALRELEAQMALRPELL